MPEPIAAISTVFTYFNPSRSPYYTIGLAACFAITYVCDVDSKSGGLWLTLAIPAYVVAALTFALSLDSSNALKREEHAEQLRFSRSTCISVAVVALALAGKGIADEKNIGLFAINAAMCCFQVLLFLIYQWALNREESIISGGQRNYVQITLLTSAFLGDTSYNLWAGANSQDSGHMHHLYSAGGLGFLWLCCSGFWIFKLAEIIRRPGQAAQEQARAAGAGLDHS